LIREGVYFFHYMLSARVINKKTMTMMMAVDVLFMI